MSKIVVIGANHAGTAAVNTILDTAPDQHQVVVFDANSNISFLGCGMALWIGGQISGPEGLFYSSQKLLQQKGALVHMLTTVTKIDFDRKIVYAEGYDHARYEEPYEKLILAEEETTSAGGCGFSLAAFSRPASACPSDRVSRGTFAA